MKIALVHDDLIQFGGAERLLLQLSDIWPDAPIYTSVASKKWLEVFTRKNRAVKTSFMQKLPLKEKLNRFYSPLMFHALAFESFDFSEFDVVLSISARYSHGIVTKPSTKHICYMNSPGRMFWESSSYFDSEKNGQLLKNTLEILLTKLRMWDYAAAQRVDYFIANSKTPQTRIKKYFKRDSFIIYPFVDLEVFKNASTEKGDNFVIISRLVPWKRVDIAVKAFNKLGLPLTIVGDGPQLEELKKMANSNIIFTGFVSEDEKVSILSSCKGLINTQKEDFGIVPLEAMACGKPVLAYRAGGALETVVEGKTGMFFDNQTPQSLISAVSAFNQQTFLKSECIHRAKKFSKENFTENVKEFVNSVYFKT